MKNINLKKELIFLPMLLLPILYIMYVWPQLPDQIAIHFDLHGTANGWGGKWAIFVPNFLTIGIYLAVLFLPQIDPKRMGTEEASSLFYKIRLAVVLFMSVMSVFGTQAALSGSMSKGLSHYMPVGLFLLFAILGNFMINIKPNWFIGIRTPWTLSSDYVWRRTHQLFGRVWFYGGLLCAVLTFLMPEEYTVALILVFALGSTLGAFGYSFWLFRKEKAHAVENKS